MHFNVIVEAIAQSDLDRRLPRDTEPAYLNDNIVDNVQVFNGTELANYSLLVNGPDGDGSRFVPTAANSANLYGFEPMAIKMLGEILSNLVLVKVSSGGSRVKVTGLVDANGSWNADFAALESLDPAIPRLLQLFETRFDAFDAWCTANSHTYTVVAAILHQGHADQANPDGYDTAWAAAITKLREIVGEPELPVIYGSIPILSSQFSKRIRAVHKNYAADPSNFAYCFDNSNGDLSPIDSTHMGPNVSLSFANWIKATYEKIVDSPVATPQPSNRNLFTTKAAAVSIYDSVGRAITKIGSLSAPQQTALRNLETALKSGGIWNKYAGIFPCVGGTESAHAIDIKNPDIAHANFLDVTHDADGIHFNGASSVMRITRFITDVPYLKYIGFGVSWYQKTDTMNADQVIVSMANGATECGLAVWPCFPTGGRMRADVGGIAGFAQSSNLVTDTLGVISFQLNGTHSQTHKRGGLRGQKAYTTDVDVNGNLQIGWNAFGGGRFFNGNLAWVAYRMDLTPDELMVEAAAIQAFQVELGREEIVDEPSFPATYQDQLDKAADNTDDVPSALVQQYQQEFFEDIGDLIDGVDVLMIYAGDADTDDFSLYNMVNAMITATLEGGMSDRDAGGWKGNGSAHYINLQFNGSLDAVNFQPDNCCVMAYVIEAHAASGAAIHGTVINSNDRMFNSTGAHRISGGTLSSSVNLGGVGFKAAARNHPENVELQSETTQFARTATQSGHANENLLNFRSVAVYGNQRLSFWVAGRYFDATERGVWRTAMRSYLTKLGFVV